MQLLSHISHKWRLFILSLPWSSKSGWRLFILCVPHHHLPTMIISSHMIHNSLSNFLLAVIYHPCTHTSTSLIPQSPPFMKGHSLPPHPHQVLPIAWVTLVATWMAHRIPWPWVLNPHLLRSSVHPHQPPIPLVWPWTLSYPEITN